MTLTRGQKIMSGIVLAVAVLFVASIRMTYFSDGAGTIKIHAKKLHGNEHGKVPVHSPKTRPSGRR